MKKMLFLSIVLAALALKAHAQGCYEPMKQKGDAAFAAADYLLAFETYELAMECADAPPDVSHVQNRRTACRDSLLVQNVRLQEALADAQEQRAQALALGAAGMAQVIKDNEGIESSLPYALLGYRADPGNPITVNTMSSLILENTHEPQHWLEAFNHDEEVTSAVFSPDGTLILTASDDKTAKLWAANDGELLHTFNHNGSVHSAVFSPDGTLVLTASSDKTARLWSANGGGATAHV